MGSFGENLRREREMRGVTLEEISAATKISVRFLKSIEDEDFSKLPGGLFNRSFVRSYARYLGLEEEPLLTEYQLAAKAKGEADLTRLSFPATHAVRTRSSRSSWVGVAAAVILLVAGYSLWRYSRGASSGPASEGKQSTAGNKSAGQPPTASAPEVPPPTANAPFGQSAAPNSAGLPAGSAPPTQPAPPTATPGAPASSAAGAAAANAPTAANPPSPALNGNELVLQVAATESAWVAVDADGKSILQGVMNPNEIKTLRAKDSFDVLTGNARGVVLTLNGETLKPLGREGEVKSIHLSRDDLKTPKSP